VSVLAPERTVDDIVAGWRRDPDADGPVNPAGPLFADQYTEFEITMTGGGDPVHTWEIFSCYYEC
jgi:hypothetical protein